MANVGRGPTPDAATPGPGAASPPPLLGYGRAAESPVRRWLRRKREYLADEMIAYRQVGIAIVFGLVVVIFFFLTHPRWIFRLFFQ